MRFLPPNQQCQSTEGYYYYYYYYYCYYYYYYHYMCVWFVLVAWPRSNAVVPG